MPRMQGMHVQGWTEYAHLATVARWLMTSGTDVQSMSQLVGLVFAKLADAIVDSGGTPVLEIGEIEEVINAIGRRRVPTIGTKGRMLRIEESTQGIVGITSRQEVPMVSEIDMQLAKETFFREKENKRALEEFRAKRSVTRDEEEDEYITLGSEPDEGEFDPTDAKRIAQEELERLKRSKESE